MALGASEYFSTRQLNALDKIGDIIVPANGPFPSFSSLGCREHIDDALCNAHQDDITALGWLLTVFGLLPAQIIRLVLRLAAWGATQHNVLGPPMRMLDTSVRALIFSLYYSNLTRCSYQGPTPHSAIDFNSHCAPDVTFDNLKGTLYERSTQ